jgi:hypothetical protein
MMMDPAFQHTVMIEMYLAINDLKSKAPECFHTPCVCWGGMIILFLAEDQNSFFILLRGVL